MLYICVFSEGFYLVSESKTLRLHTNQEEEYPAIMREYGVLKNPFTTIRVHMCVYYVHRTISNTITIS